MECRSEATGESADLPGAGSNLERAKLAKRDQRRSAREALASRGDKVPDALTRPTSAAIWRACLAPGEVAEWLKAADCKSARASVRWFESSPLHQPSLKLRLASQHLATPDRLKPPRMANQHRLGERRAHQTSLRIWVNAQEEGCVRQPNSARPCYEIVQLSRIDVSCFGLGSSLLY